LVKLTLILNYKNKIFNHKKTPVKAGGN